MKIDHIGYLTHDMEKAIRLFEGLGFTQETNVIVDDKVKREGDHPLNSPRNVRLCFLTNGSYCVELVNPMDESSAAAGMLKRQGDGPYHICYQTPRLQEKVEEMKGAGWIVVQKPAWAVAFESGGVAFLFKKNVGLIELREVSEEKTWKGGHGYGYRQM